jgi:hypothetical protein
MGAVAAIAAGICLVLSSSMRAFWFRKQRLRRLPQDGHSLAGKWSVMTRYSTRASILMNHPALQTVSRDLPIERWKRYLSAGTPHLSRARLVRVAVAALGMLSPLVFSQTPQMPSTEIALSGKLSLESICSAQTQDSAKAALRHVCQERRLVREQAPASQTIVIGFVGGFANPHDVKHPEVLFAAFLRQHYASGVHARVFSNHDRNGALKHVKELLDTNHDGSLSDEEKKSARIIIYGHSWGASETVAFARTLEHYSIPVLLTVQLDTVGKWGQQPSRIPSNVESAINFYQSEGFLRGRSEIAAADKTQTEIIGNYRFTYTDNPIDCGNYPWLARTFNKPHHEIENDPKVWSQIAWLIGSRIMSNGDSDILSANVSTATSEAALPDPKQNPSATSSGMVNK